MQLFILRHADADTVAATDGERRLSDKGLEQARKVARFCETHRLNVGAVLSSPVRRAHETALIVSDLLRTELIIAPWLACGMTPEVAVTELATYRSQPSLMIVGHEPDLSRLIGFLLGSTATAPIHVRKASLTALELFSVRQGGGHLEFSLPCRLM